jgi:DNA-binding beta-propeller fold protein YncE
MSALRFTPLLLLLLLPLSCDSVAPTESPDRPSLHSRKGSHGNNSETVLIVGNFIPMATTNSILRYTTRGDFIDVMVNLSLPGGPRGGCCMAFGADENLWVSAVGGAVMAGRVNRFNGVTGEFIDVVIPPATGGLVRPLAIALGPDNNMYVGDIETGSESIYRFDGRTGAFIDEFVPPDRLGGSPQLFVFGRDGHLYVAIPSLNAVRRFNGSTGAFIDDFVVGTAGEPIASGLTFGPDRNLYVGVGNGVNRYDRRTGELIDTFVDQGSGGLSGPVGMVFGPDRDLYVASGAVSTGNGSILRYDGKTGEFIDAFVPISDPNVTGPRMLEFKSTIRMCHRSTRHPDRQRTIAVGYLSASEHVAHGDEVGPCPEWSTPVSVSSVSSSGTELEVSVSRDERTLYIASNRSGDFDIWASEREGDEWSEPQNIGAPINTSAREQGPFVSRDGRSLYFYSDRDNPGGQTDIYVSRRRHKRDDWGEPVKIVGGVNTAESESLPVLFEDDHKTTLYFTRSGDIYSSNLERNGTFGPAALVTELSSSRRDRVLSIRRDGLEIFLASDRPGPAPAPFDLWVSTRRHTRDAWSAPEKLPPMVNSAADEGGASLSADAGTLYFISNRSGTHDVWMTTRRRPQRDDHD